MADLTCKVMVLGPPDVVRRSLRGDWAFPSGVDSQRERVST